MMGLTGSVGRWHGHRPEEKKAEEEIVRKKIAEHRETIESARREIARLRKVVRNETLSLARLEAFQ